MIHVSRIAVPVVTLVAGIALGAYYGTPSVKEQETEPSQTTKVKFEKDAGQDATIRGLRARIAELERQLAEKGEAAAAAEEKLEEEGRLHAGRHGRHGPPSMAEMRKSMEEFKRNHPEEAAAMEKRRQEFMRRVKQREQANLEFLADIDTTNMSDTEREQHTNYQNLLARRAELREKMGSQNLSDEERDQVFEELRETEHEIRASSGQMRENLIKRTAEALGFEGDEVGEIADTIQAVLDATDSGGGHGPRGPGGPGGSGGGSNGGASGDMPPPPPPDGM